MSWLDEVRFNEKGLIPVIAQDVLDDKILMVAWMNKESLTLTVEKQQAVYWSRSRQKLWHKGETSGHFQKIHDIYLDCDADVITIKVTQLGGIACHTGRKSCFYKKLVDGKWMDSFPVLKNPDDIYKNATSIDEISTTEIQAQNDKNPATLTNSLDTLTALSAILEQRKTAKPDSSYVASLYHKGLNKILEKVGEEAVETIISAKELQIAQLTNDENTLHENQKRTPRHDLVYEVADLWFHSLVMLSSFNIEPSEIITELARRFGVSGHEEKASR